MRETLLQKTARHAEPQFKEVCENVSGDWGRAEIRYFVNVMRICGSRTRHKPL